MVTSDAVANTMLPSKTITFSEIIDVRTTLKTSIPVNAGESNRNGFLLLYMSHTSSAEYTFVKLYLVRVGYSGNNHIENVISESGSLPAQYTPTFDVSPDGYLTIYSPLQAAICIL